MRYMIATSLLLLGSGTGRAFLISGGMPFPQGVEYSFILTDIIAIALIVYDKIKGNSLKPYLVMAGICRKICRLVFLIFHQRNSFR